MMSSDGVNECGNGTSGFIGEGSHKILYGELKWAVNLFPLITFL